MTHCDIDEVKPALSGGNHGRHGWGFAVNCGVIGDDAPYRAILARLAASGETNLSLPQPEPREDCVEGYFEWRSQRIQVYFECQVLSYLNFWSPERAPIELVRAEVSKQLL